MFGKIFTLGVLYFVQGLPYGFQDKFIPLYLRQSGFSHTGLSLMKLLLLPWLCKAGLAPLVDLYRSKWFWLMFSLVALTIVSLIGMFISTQYFVLLSVWLLLLNLFSAFQDVSVDALAMHILRGSELGHGNTAQIVGYKLGALFGGGVLFWIHYYHGWTYLCLSLASLYIMAIVAFLPMFTQRMMKKQSVKKSESDNDTSTEQSFDIQESSARQRIQTSADAVSDLGDIAVTPTTPISPLKEHCIREIPFLVFSTEGTVAVVIFLLAYKLGERAALNTFPLFLIDQGISTKDIGLWSGIYGQLASLSGSVFSGWLISRKWNLSTLLNFGLFVRLGPVLIQCVIVNLWYDDMSSTFYLFYLSVLSMCALEFAAGFVTTCVFTLMMSCSLKAPSNLQATHYSVLASVEVAGKLLFASFSGVLVDLFNISRAFAIFVVLAGLPSYLLQHLDVF